MEKIIFHLPRLWSLLQVSQLSIPHEVMSHKTEDGSTWSSQKWLRSHLGFGPWTETVPKPCWRAESLGQPQRKKPWAQHIPSPGIRSKALTLKDNTHRELLPAAATRAALSLLLMVIFILADKDKLWVQQGAIRYKSDCWNAANLCRWWNKTEKNVTHPNYFIFISAVLK